MPPPTSKPKSASATNPKPLNLSPLTSFECVLVFVRQRATMAGQNRRARDRKFPSTAEKSLFSMINIFKRPQFSKRSQGSEEVPRPERHWVSDEDQSHYFGEPDVDKKATDFISRFYEARMTEGKTVVV